MSFASLFSSLKPSRPDRTRKAARRNSSRTRSRVRVELLEDRVVPSVLFWSGGAGAGDTNWMSAANWGGNVVPAAGDNLIFPNGPTQTNTNNNFDAGTTFGSILITGSGYSLAGNAITLQSGGLSDSGGSAAVFLPITLGAAESLINSSSGTLTLSGGIDQNGFQLTLDGNGPTTVNGMISGAGGLVKAGGGTVVLAVANNYTGTTQINAGTLDMQNAQALGTTDGTTATGTTVFGGTLKLHGSFTLPNEALTLSGGTLYSTTDNTWPGSITVTSGSSFQIDAGQTLQANLATSGAVSLGVGGSGTLELTGSNALVTGSGFEVYSTLQVDGSLTGSSVYLHSGAILRGAGTVGGKVFLNGDYGVNGRLQASGTVGDVSSLDRYYAYYTGGTVDPAGPSGTAVLQTGNLQLRGGTLAAQLNGSTPGTGYDQVKVMGEVEVSNATLQVTLGFTPVVGQQFTLIDNDGTDAVTGTFAGLPEGALLPMGNVVFQVSYQGGDGNDVTLTRIAADVWSGGGADGNWSTLANWAGGTAPAAGDLLLFPGGVTNVTTTNDLTPGIVISKILVTGAGYSLAGNAITLQSGGLSDSGGSAAVFLPITLGAAESLINSSSGTLTLSGGIDQNGFQLTLDGNGPTTVNGMISGAGGLVKAGGGTVVLAVANNYTGTTQINAGTLDMQNAQARGRPTAQQQRARRSSAAH